MSNQPSPAHSHVTVIRHGTIWTGGEHPRLLHDHDLVIEAGRVASIEPNFGNLSVKSNLSGEFKIGRAHV